MFSYHVSQLVKCNQSLKISVQNRSTFDKITEDRKLFSDIFEDRFQEHLHNMLCFNFDKDRELPWK